MLNIRESRLIKIDLFNLNFKLYIHQFLLIQFFSIFTINNNIINLLMIQISTYTYINFSSII